jgi:tetratricopeptide (TPR) repeat protein
VIRSLFLWTLLSAPAWAADEVDHLGIATRLVADGLWDRAAAVLDEVPQPSPDEAVRFHTLRGLVALQLSDPQGALQALDAAVQAADGAEEPIDGLVHVYRAQALAALQRHAEAIDALDAAGDAGEQLAGTWQLRARSEEAVGELDAAYDTLRAGRDRFPQHLGLAEDQLLLLVRLGLTRAVLDEGATALHELGAGETTWVGIGDRLRAAGALPEAMAWLEEARLRFPRSVDARVGLASACLQAERPRCAGEALQEAAAFDPAYAVEAAECFRRAGDLDRALYLNGLVDDPAAKVRQRLGLLLEQGRFAQAAALDPRLRRLGLLDEDEQLAYALAYAFVQTGQRDRAEALLRTLTDPRLFQQATALREAMARCEETGQGCGG